MSLNDLPKPSEVPIETASASAAPSRRQLLKGLGAASPIILSVASGPVFAQVGNVVCLNPSGFISQNTFLSRHPMATTCSTSGPTFFRDLALASYPSDPPDLRTVPFLSSSLFGPANSGADSGLIGLGDVLKTVLGNTSVSAFTKYAIAAYLNARIQPGFPVSPAQALAAWKNFRGGVPTPFIPPSWTEATAIAWYQTLMPA